MPFKTPNALLHGTLDASDSEDPDFGSPGTATPSPSSSKTPRTTRSSSKKGRCTLRFTAWNAGAGSRPSGVNQSSAGGPSSIASHVRGARSSMPRRPRGVSSRQGFRKSCWPSESRNEIPMRRSLRSWFRTEACPPSRDRVVSAFRRPSGVGLQADRVSPAEAGHYAG